MVAARFRDLNRQYEIDQKEAAYRDLKPPSAEQEQEFRVRKKKPTKFLITHRVVTPLFIASERVVAPADSKEESKDDPQKHRGGFTEMSRLDSCSPYDLFSLGVLKAIFSYVDLGTLKLGNTTQYFVVGHFVALILEVITPQDCDE